MRGRRISWWGSVFALIAVIGASAPPPPSALTVATYNVANYNLTDRPIEGGFRTHYPKPEREKSALRRVLHALDADVVALQEIGGASFLRELRRDLKGEGLDYPHAHVLDAADETRRVAVMSRIPLTTIVDHTDLNFKYFAGRAAVKRGLLEARFETAGGEVTLFIVHLKSKLTELRDDPESAARRGSEATVIRDRILEQFPDPAAARFLIVGDFNADPTERPFRAFTRRGDLVISEAVDAFDSRDETWTHRYRRADLYSRVDFVLASPLVLPTVVNGRATIHDGPATLTASDHRPVVVRLAFD
ncbi:endonuclease/exonuclease/phosphatase family protein [Synoicihabitans lomoniglobus]|uniref:Endonuclease/exonuclease/phosphatase family protein n=1 Tax=Synoicihabitans lomoniglobus TaxID=2909285 RepID=A0AAF0CR26_9BACT|nr:endonuclease/exonuclease/phosphatase family protein [Opitutaceae bacterium LMO-M01]WED66411.1 endonuclease/exonuclease/phosphatase family protein [Opitutaceae bacterium LMO-M01]